MKQYTTSEQTAKLIELGFEKPKTKLLFEVANDELGYAYSIGELIEMLPRRIGDYALFIYTNWEGWIVDYNPDISVKTKFYCVSLELVDALYDMVVQLKEEGVI